MSSNIIDTSELIMMRTIIKYSSKIVNIVNLNTSFINKLLQYR